MWTEKTARLFAKVMADFEPTVTGKLFRKHIEEFLLDQGYPKLAKKFLYFARRSDEIRKCVEDAKQAIVCPCCKDAFIRGDFRVVCSACYKTEKGRYLAGRIKARTNNETFVKQKLKELSYTKEEQKLAFRKVFKLMVEKNWTLSQSLYNVTHDIKELPLCKTCKTNYVVRNTSPATRNKVRYAEHCSTKCAANDKDLRAKMARIISEFSEEKWHDIRRRATITSQTLVKVKAGGRVYLCQGFEKQIIPKLVKKFGVDNVISQFDPEFKGVRLSAGKYYTPDAYIKHLDVYVDAKSTWTFMDMNPGLFRLNKRKQKEMGDKLRFIIYKRDTDKGTIVMPPDWYLWSDTKVRDYVRG
jgi:hypothetical protein